MKKLFCLVLAVLMLFAAAMAEEVVDSKNTGDMTIVEVESEKIPEGSEFTVIIDTLAPVIVPDAVDATEGEAEAPVLTQAQTVCAEEIEKLAQSESAEAYFGEIKDIQGNVVVLTEALEAEKVNVYEFAPVVVSAYDEAYGDVKATMQFSTPYAADEKVLVLVGLVNAETGEIEWTAFEGVGVGEEGAIKVTFTAEILKAIQNGTALLAVASK